MLKDAGWRDMGLESDDIDWARVRALDQAQFAAACRAFGLNPAELEAVEPLRPRKPHQRAAQQSFIACANGIRCRRQAGTVPNTRPVASIASAISNSVWPSAGSKATPVARASQWLMANDSA